MNIIMGSLLLKREGKETTLITHISTSLISAACMLFSHPPTKFKFSIYSNSALFEA
jgi:hypothetical protein